MRRLSYAALLLCAAAAARAGAAQAERVVTVDTRPGVSQSFVVVEPGGPPVASVVLFPGGSGTLALWRRTEPLPRERGNFLVRTRDLFAAHGFRVAVVDVPSDRRDDGLVGFRHTAAHRADIAAVVRWLRTRARVPVWLIGTSRGTVSVAHLAATMRIDGAVLTAIVTVSGGRRPATALDARIEDVTVPVLLVNHRDDDCFVTPSSNLFMVEERLKRSPKVSIMKFTGGRAEDQNACAAMTRHGFLGIERTVVDAIAGWIKARLKP